MEIKNTKAFRNIRLIEPIRCRPIVLALLIVVLFPFVGPADEIPELAIQFPEGLKQRTGQLTLTVKVDPSVFSEKGYATVQNVKGPSNLLKEGKVEYSIKNSILYAKVDFTRPTIQKLSFKFSLQVIDKNNRLCTFEQKKEDSMDPLLPEHCDYRLKVKDFPQYHRNGQLTLTAKVNSSDDFNSSGSANLEVNTTRGFSNFLREGEVKYNIEGSILQTKVDFIRHDTMDHDSTLALLVTNKGNKEFVFLGKSHLGPLIPSPLQIAQRKGELILTATVYPNTFTFNSEGPATLEAQVLEGPPVFLKEKSECKYYIKDSKLQTILRFPKVSTTVSLMLKLSVNDKSGIEHTFATPTPYMLELSKPFGAGNLKSVLGWFYIFLRNHYYALFLVIPIGYVLWLHSQRKPNVMLPNQPVLQLDQNSRGQETIIEFIVRRQAMLSIKWVLNQGNTINSPIEVSYALHPNKPKELKPEELANITVNPKRLFILPIKKRTFLTIYFKLPELVELPFRHKFHYEVCWKRGKSKKSWEREVELVLNKPADNTLIWKHIEGLSININNLQKEFDKLKTTVSSHLPIPEIIISLPGKVAILEQLFGKYAGKPFEQLINVVPDITFEESKLLTIVNNWWQEGNLDRKILQKLLEKSSLPTNFYAIKNITDNLTKLTFTNEYTFVPSDDEGSWLWYQRPRDEYILAVPVDPRLLGGKQGGEMTIIKRMFSGFNEIPDNVQFEKVNKACRLQAIPERFGKYKLVSQGHILLAGYPDTGPPLQQAKRKDYLASREDIPEKYKKQMDQFASDLEQLKQKMGVIERQQVKDQIISNQRGKEQETIPETLDLKFWEDIQKASRESKESVASNDQLPSGWAEAMIVAFEKSEIDRGKTTDNDYYVKRLLDLKETLQKYFENSQSSILVKIVHLEIVDNNFRLYIGELKDDGNRWSFIRTGQQALPDDLLFQLFIALEINQRDFVWVLLPLGSFSKDKYPQGYKALLEKVPNETVQITFIRRPAKLQKKTFNNDDLYVVNQNQKMQLEYSEV